MPLMISERAPRECQRDTLSCGRALRGTGKCPAFNVPRGEYLKQEGLPCVGPSFRCMRLFTWTDPNIRKFPGPGRPAKSTPVDRIKPTVSGFRDIALGNRKISGWDRVESARCRSFFSDQSIARSRSPLPVQSAHGAIDSRAAARRTGSASRVSSKATVASASAKAETPILGETNGPDGDSW